ncbi:hypothetical protein L2520_07890 [Limosilactobacillus vaginalis]|uniref:Holin n=1 Tax=Limosilactobacillus vaginalis TaxID=1633 RepID=A0ABT4K5W8_9LACO|nr:hypothetical protein [Limosilactobacillus vaginalis]MCZ3746302.1 hypothetical protein [Limosilactobacillus vaginalis]MCZ3751284.1 hypothetical protein [Limosilactobacillus vaginalis]MCZ3752898.1 hypothetical protein [Limosilactobacillus vaginalis]MCZ3755715.1 hypothetical protein [Limosilactobacillus vaginalis]MCZ3756345.1 hypothetical protein [Limosilactobacillus vaginalis]
MFPVASVHEFLGYSPEDWVAIFTIIVMIAGGFQWVRKSSKKTIDNIEHNILGPIYDELSKLNHNMQVSNEQYERAQKRLEDGDKKFIRHDEQLKDHERRITTLERGNHK